MLVPICIFLLRKSPRMVEPQRVSSQFGSYCRAEVRPQVVLRYALGSWSVLRPKMIGSKVAYQSNPLLDKVGDHESQARRRMHHNPFAAIARMTKQR